MSQRSTGRVKWFNEKKGFGFIVIDESQEDIFVHYKDIDGEGFRTLHENDSVSFMVDKGPKGFKAQNVVLLPDEA